MHSIYCLRLSCALARDPKPCCGKKAFAQRLSVHCGCLAVVMLQSSQWQEGSRLTPSTMQSLASLQGRRLYTTAQLMSLLAALSWGELATCSSWLLRLTCLALTRAAGSTFGKAHQSTTQALCIALLGTVLNMGSTACADHATAAGSPRAGYANFCKTATSATSATSATAAAASHTQAGNRASASATTTRLSYLGLVDMSAACMSHRMFVYA